MTTELGTNLLLIPFFSEQKCFDLEKQLITSNGKLVTQTKDISELRQQHTELGNALFMNAPCYEI